MEDNHSESEESSPEGLLTAQPSLDPYSSDDQYRTKVRSIPRCDPKHTFILRRHHDSSDFTSECSHFFLYTDFRPIKQEISIQCASIEQCLYQALKFTQITTHSWSTPQKSVHCSSKTCNVDCSTGLPSIQSSCGSSGSHVIQCSSGAHSFPGIHNQSSDQLSIDGDTVKEIIHQCTKNFKGLSWIIENDTFNFKTLCPEEKNRLGHFFLDFSSSANTKNFIILTHANFVKNVYTLFQDVYDSRSGNLNSVQQSQLANNTGGKLNIEKRSDIENNKNVNDKSCVYSDVTSLSCKPTLVHEYLEQLTSFVPNYFFLRHDECKTEFPLHVQDIDIRPGSLLVEDRDVLLGTRPHGVFVRGITHKYFPLDRVWQMVVEVYDPMINNIERPVDQSLRLAHNSECYSKVFQDIAQKRNHRDQQTKEPPPKKPRTGILDLLISNIENNKPVRTINSIGNPDYCSKVREYIKQSLPIQCRSSLIAHQMSGQHVLHLFQQAKQNMKYNENTVKSDLPMQKAIGLFIVNEFVYFSKLLVEQNLLQFINTGFSSDEDFDELVRTGKVTAQVEYSNFCFDLTIAKHRIALIIFLHHMLLRK